MTDSQYTSPCHPDVKLYAHPLGMELICACGRAYTNPAAYDTVVVDGKNRRGIR